MDSNVPKVLLVFKKASKERSSAEEKAGKAFEPLPCKILMMKYKLVKCTENWLKCPAQRISVNGKKSSWGIATKEAAQEELLLKSPLMTFFTEEETK